MEKKKKTIKLIHIILIGCIFMIGIVSGIVYTYITSESDNAIKDVIQNISGNTKTNDIKLANNKYFNQEVEVQKEPKITTNNDCQNSLGIKDIKIDNDNLILKLELNTTNNPIKQIDNVNIINNAKLEVGNEIYHLNQTYLNFTKMIEVNKNLYEVYLFYDLEGLKYNKKIKFISNIVIEEFEEYYADVDVKVFEIGNWNVEFEVNRNMKTDYNEKYEIENLILEIEKNEEFSEETFEVLKVIELEDNLLINGLLLGYTTEPGIRYSVEFFDQNDNSLMLNGKELLIGGIRQDILVKKFDLDSKIKVQFKKFIYHNNELLGETRKIFKLSDYIKNVEEKVEIIKNAYNEDLSFDYDSEKWEIRSDNVFDVIDLANLKYPINITRDSINEYSRDISIMKYENIFDETLEEIFENRQKLLELGISRPRGEKYSLGVNVGPFDEYGNPADVKFYEFTDAEIMDIYNGKKVVKEDMEFDKDSFTKHMKDGYNFKVEYKNYGKVNFNGKEAITFVNETESTSDRSYIVIVNDYIYEIHVPSDLCLENAYYKIVDSIVFK